MKEGQTQLTIYMPDRVVRDRTGAMLDNAADRLGFRSRRAMLYALLSLPEDEFVATMQPLAERHWTAERERLRLRHVAQRRRRRVRQ